MRTIGLLIAFPHKAGARLTQDKDESAYTHVLPFTFLAIGYFFFAMVVEVTSENIFNAVWLGDDIAKQVYENVREGVTILQIVTASLPGIAIVVFMSGIFSFFLYSDRGERGRFVRFSCFVFGYQCIAFFIVVSCIFLDEILSRARTAGTTASIPLSAEITDTLLVVASVFFLVSGIFSPLINILFFHRSVSTEARRISMRGNTLSYVVLVAFSFATPVVYTFSASAVSRLTTAIVPPPKASLNALAPVNVTAIDNDSVTFSFLMTVKNPHDRWFALSLDDITVSLGLSNYDGGLADSWSTEIVAIAGEGASEMGDDPIAVPPQSGAWARVQVKTVFARSALVGLFQKLVREDQGLLAGARFLELVSDLCLAMEVNLDLERVKSDCLFRTFKVPLGIIPTSSTAGGP